MTEQEWLAATDWEQMLDFLRGNASERKLRLGGVACCRKVWDLLGDERTKQAVVLAEKFSDNLVSIEEMQTCGFAAEDASNEAYRRGDDLSCNSSGAALLTAQASDLSELNERMTSIIVDVIEAARFAGLMSETGVLRDIRYVIRDIFGNPFRPITVDRFWLSPTVTSVAQTIYDDRQLPSGLFDNQRMGVLADALEEAGCDNADILGHLRGGGDHVRGCWPVDLILGRE